MPRVPVARQQVRLLKRETALHLGRQLGTRDQLMVRRRRVVLERLMQTRHYGITVTLAASIDSSSTPSYFHSLSPVRATSIAVSWAFSWAFSWVISRTFTEQDTAAWAVSSTCQ